jgi:TIR domain/Pentapeptide repeats (8 copies)
VDEFGGVEDHMASIKQLDILKKGIDSWNLWRINNSNILPSLSEAALHMAYLKEANLSKADLTDADLRMAELVEANLNQADLTWANLNEAVLRNANLERAKIQKANLARADLEGANFNKAILTWSTLGRSNLRSTSFVNANLNAANLSGSDLSGADLKNASLVGANLTRANLDGVDLSNCIVGGTLFGNVDLSVVKGLETLVHLGPSPIGIDTVYKSKGKIPEVFLKSAGVPKDLIDFIDSHIGQTEELFSCFISYAGKDETFVHKLFGDLLEEGVRCWLISEQVRKKERYYPLIDAALNLHEKELLVMSENSLESDWLENEIFAAFEKEEQTGEMILLPIMLDDSVKYSEKPWVAKVRRSRQVYDFSLWQDEETFKEMLGALTEELKYREEIEQ